MAAPEMCFVSIARTDAQSMKTGRRGVKTSYASGEDKSRFRADLDQIVAE